MAARLTGVAGLLVLAWLIGAGFGCWSAAPVLFALAELLVMIAMGIGALVVIVCVVRLVLMVIEGTWH